METDLAADDSSSVSATAENIETVLQKPFYYQKQPTNQPSAAPLTLRQLCRILCLGTNTRVVNTTKGLTESTLLIGFNASTKQYDIEGWKTAKDTKILKYAVGKWYYEFGKKAQGPISCRELSNLFNKKIATSSYEEAEVTLETRVWSAEIGGEWKTIRECGDLQVAMKAFVNTPLPFDLNLNNKKNNQTDKEQATPVPFDDEVMVHDDDTGRNSITSNTTNEQAHDLSSTKDQLLLSNFLSSTGHQRGEDEEDIVDEYESDGGTTYVKMSDDDQWINSRLLPPNHGGRKRKMEEHDAMSNSKSESSRTAVMTSAKKKKGSNKAKFKAKNAKCWVYVTNLPVDTNELEVAKYFSKVGVLDLNHETQRPKVKLYRYKSGEVMRQTNTNEVLNGDTAKGGELKGDASICYVRPESVQLALQILDDSIFRDSSATTKDVRINVQPAKFEQHGTKYKQKKSVSNIKRKVSRLAALQAIGWDDNGENGRITGGLKGLRIIVLKYMFTLSILKAGNEDKIIKELEHYIHEQCSQYGTVEKITVFSKNEEGVVLVKFTQPSAASQAIEHYNGKIAPMNFGGKELEAVYWDGVTDYTVRDLEKEEEETKERLDEFGSWLDNQELPDEFQLQVE